jgi:DNA-binding transcriptional regulator YdaS (Cro superfamily)
MPPNRAPNPKAADAWAAIKAGRRVNRAWLADALGITRSAIEQWPMVPAERVVEISRLTGIPREELRPDLYEPHPTAWSQPKG